MSSGNSKESRAPLDVFVPERFLKHKEFLVELNNEWGLVMKASELGPSVKSGRIAAEVITNRAFTTLY